MYMYALKYCYDDHILRACKHVLLYSFGILRQLSCLLYFAVSQRLVGQASVCDWSDQRRDTEAFSERRRQRRARLSQHVRARRHAVGGDVISGCC